MDSQGLHPAPAAVLANAIMGCFCGMYVDDLCAIMEAAGYAMVSNRTGKANKKMDDALGNIDGSRRECITGAIIGVASSGATTYATTAAAGAGCAAAGMAEGAADNAIDWWNSIW